MILAQVLLTLVAQAEVPTDTAPLFHDKNLEAAIRERVFSKRGTEQPLTPEDVKDLSEIAAKGKKIRDLRGLEKCRALASLDLSGNEIEDLAPISELRNLQALFLAKNRIKEVNSLACLVGLQYLDLSDNQVVDLAPLRSLTRLNNLCLSNNKISDASGLSGLSRLWSLYLNGNCLSGVEPVKDLKHLSTLSLSGNRISDLSPLADLTELRFLFLENNQVTDLGTLVGMARKDAEKEKRFAPYWRIYLSGNPLSPSARTSQLTELTGDRRDGLHRGLLQILSAVSYSAGEENRQVLLSGRGGRLQDDPGLCRGSSCRS